MAPQIATAALLLLLPFFTSALPTAEAAACPAHAQVCNVALKATPPQGSRCGASGSLKQPAHLGAACTSTIKNCRDSCLASANCASFRYTQSTGTCQRYTGAKTTQFRAGSHPASVYYDRGCFTAAKLSSRFLIGVAEEAASSYDGSFLSLDESTSDAPGITHDVASAAVFSLNSSGQLNFNPGNGTVFIGNTNSPDNGNGPVTFDTASDIADAGNVDLTCAVAGVSGSLTCDAQSGRETFINMGSGQLGIADPEDGAFFTHFLLTAKCPSS